MIGLSALRHRNRKGGIKLGPDVISFFKDNYSLLRYNAANHVINDSQNYRKFYQDIHEEGSAQIGWQLSVILAIIVSVCERNEFRQTQMLTQDSQASRLLRAEEISMGESEFALGKGLLRN
ncbi:hypothetical protein IPG36_05355 [bacterium]|nr:MAG: hypothetical protein IPG36_05355 [bacterium]